MPTLSLQAADQAGRVVALAAHALDIFVELVHQRCHRQAGTDLVCGGQANSKIFAHPIHRKAKVELILQHGFMAVHHLPTARSTLRDHLDHRRAI